MRLRGTYYKEWSAHYGGDEASFHVELLPGCDVYRGISPLVRFVRAYAI
ncbi:hypothetical protein QUW14_02265 [Bacteroides gallinaceum]|nr:hypothetical protein [Bacteroides gallinaceum]MDM8153149.1 hypothetical protein [Bacteroides gallinaceum]